MRWVGMTAAAVACWLAAGVGHADGPDDQFVASLSADGITGDPGRLIATGHEVCDWQNLPHNENPWSPYGQKRTQLMNELQSQGLSGGQANQFIMAAIVAYCPDKRTW